MRMIAAAAAALMMSSILLPAEAPAHHAFSAEFSRDLPIEVSGTVTKIEWTNPHARFYVEAVGEDGEPVMWDFELTSPNVLMRRGWKRDSLKPGDKVTVNGWRARNSPHVGNAGKVTLADGKQLFSLMDD